MIKCQTQTLSFYAAYCMCHNRELWSVHIYINPSPLSLLCSVGNLLFYLHEGMLIIFLGEFKRNINQESFLKVGKTKFEEIIKIMNESKAILINEPEGSPEYQKIKALTMDSANLQPLLEYFGITL